MIEIKGSVCRWLTQDLQPTLLGMNHPTEGVFRLAERMEPHSGKDVQLRLIELREKQVVFELSGKLLVEAKPNEDIIMLGDHNLEATLRENLLHHLGIEIQY